MSNPDSSEHTRLERLLGHAWDALPLAAVILDQDGTIRYASDQSRYLLGYDSGQLVGTEVENLMAMPEEVRSQSHGDGHERPDVRLPGDDLDFYARHRNGGVIPVRLFMTQVEDSEQDGVWTLVFLQDRRPFQADQEADSRAEKRYRQLFDQEQVGLVWARLDGKVLSCNPAAAKIMGYESAEQFEGESFEKHYRGDPEKRSQTFARLRSKGEVSSWNVPMERKGGSPITILESLVLHEDSDYDESIVVSSFVEVTQQTRLWQELKQMAYHDPLTGLPNRRFLKEQARKVFALADRQDRCAGVAYLDLNGFKAVNDRWGHEVGDEVLVAIAERAARSVRESDVLARIGGDEFAVLWADLDEPEEVITATQRVLEIFEEPLQIGDKKFHLDFSAGVATFPKDGEKIGELLRQADQAMYEAKEKGGGIATASMTSEPT